MNLDFEIRETDLLGRNGVVRVNGRRFETPCLLPVIHPVRQIVPPKELARMGFDALMTNAYILWERKREEAIKTGLHQLVGFDGAMMTDSGGYQVLEYGALNLTYSQIARFQSQIGSDLAVTLDRPTGYSRSRKYAGQTVQYSLENAVGTISRYGRSRTTWVGPIQGGLFPGLVKESARGMVDAGFQFLALGSPTPVMENYRFDELASMLLAARKAIPYSMPLHLFGAGHPLTMALSIALGSDSFDSASYILFARQGRYMTERGVLEIADIQFLPCNCPSCNSTSPRDLRGLPAGERTRKLALHNLYTLRKELLTCRQAISEGRLWDLVTERAASHPSLGAALRILNESPDALLMGTALIKGRGLFIRGPADEGRPELRLASRRMRTLKSKDGDNAVVFLSDHRLPSNLFKMKSRTRRAIQKGELDAYRIHPQLGAYPLELDFVYPFTQTVQSATPPTDEELRQGVRTLKASGYKHVSVEKARPSAAQSDFLSKNKRK